VKSYQIIIETPKDSREKYSYDPKQKGFVLKKLLPLGMVFPFDFGFIPGTKGEDGDPLDAMLFSEFKTFPGCHVACRLIGMLKAEQSEGAGMLRNDRYFFVPESSLLYQHIQTTDDLPAQLVKELLIFFTTYNKEEGKKFKPLQVLPAKKAAILLTKQTGEK
jgi:inorganic pyrophosphatase